MTFTTPDPAPSGQDLAVVAVRGRTPRILQDFVGDAVFTVQWRDQDLLVAGIGTLVGSGVRFHEKDAGNGGKDVRVWSITSSTPPGLFFASLSAGHLLTPVEAGPVGPAADPRGIDHTD